MVQFLCHTIGGIMNLDHLNYFKTLVELRSRSATAEKLSITPSTLSLALGKLEQEVGVTLIKKKRGEVELTSEGESFYEYVDTSLRFLNNGLEMLHEKQGSSQHEIVIGTVFSVQSKDWSRIINLFRARTHGNVLVKVDQSTTPSLIEKIKRGTVDVAFAGTMGDDPDVRFNPCWAQEAVLVVNRLHPFASRKEISLEELADHYLISYSLTGPIGAELTNLIKSYDLTIDCLYSDEITLASMVVGNPDIMAIACHSWILDSYDQDLTLIKISEAPETFIRCIFARTPESSNPKRSRRSLTPHWSIARVCRNPDLRIIRYGDLNVLCASVLYEVHS